VLYQCTKAIAVSGDEHGLTTFQISNDFVVPKWHHSNQNVFEALSFRDVVSKLGIAFVVCL